MNLKIPFGFLLSMMFTFAVAQQPPPKTEVRCGGNCERTFYHFTGGEPVEAEYRENAHEEKGWVKVKRDDENVKAEMEEDARKKLKKEAAKLQGEETEPCKDSNGKVDDTCECKRPPQPKDTDPGWQKENPPGAKMSGELSFPYSYKGGTGVDVTVRYQIQLKYDRLIKVKCKCEVKKPKAAPKKP